MAVQKVLPVQNSILRNQAKTVQNFDKRIQKVIKDLEDTLVAQRDPEGVGLAAPQVGISTKLFVVLTGKKIMPFINPEITWKSDETNDPKPANRKTGKLSSNNQQLKTEKLNSEYIMEGCLSLPHYYGPVKRAKSVIVKYQKPKLENGEWQMENVEETLTGLPAQIIQHEVDHLNGVIFIDRLLEQKRKLYHWSGEEWEEVELP